MKVKKDHHSKFSNLSNWKEGIAEVTDSNPVEALIFLIMEAEDDYVETPILPYKIANFI